MFYEREPNRLDSASPLPFFFFFLSFDIDDEDASFNLLLAGFTVSRSGLLICCSCSFESGILWVIEDFKRSVEVEGVVVFAKDSSWRAIATPLSWFVRRSLERMVFGCGLVIGLSTERRGERAVWMRERMAMRRRPRGACWLSAASWENALSNV